MPRYAVLDCEDAPKWNGHAKLWSDNLRRPGDEWLHPRVYAGELPRDDVDGVVITGSHYSAIDDSLPWLADLLGYLNRAADRGVRIVGACFGCQAVARAFGGVVAENPHGRFVFGADDIEVQPEFRRQEWAAPLEEAAERDRLTLLESHMECVLELPPGSVRLGWSKNSPNEVFLVRAHVLAIQGHPELTPALLEERILPSLLEKGRFTEDEVPELMASMDRRLDSRPVLRAIRAFLES